MKYKEFKNKFNEEEKVKKSFIKHIFMFIVFNLVFSIVTIPFLIFYGPFENLKKTAVGSIETTMRFQFVARLFLSESDIENILSGSYAVDPTKSGEEIEELTFNEEKNNKIELYNVEGKSFKGYMIVINNPKSVKVGYSGKLGDVGETTSSIAKRNGAIAAINAGGFSDYKWTGTGGVPLGFIINDGKIIFDDEDNPDEPRDTIGITDEGMLIVGSHSMNKIKEYNIQEGVTFGPPLVVNGEPTIESGDGGWGIAPRAAIAQRYDGAIIFLVIDGRSVGSLGASLKDVQDILLEYNVVNAANLDGGSSTTLYYDGDIVNTPSDSLGERTIPSVFMVVPAEGDK